MNSRQPPRLAVWLLRYFGVSGGNEPLAGDLLEEFCGGRTAGWYWRQTFMAIVAEFPKRFRTYRQDLLQLFLGWCAETSVVVSLWLFHVPVGVRSLVLGVPALAMICLVMYVEYRVRLHLWMNDDSDKEESDYLLDRNIRPRCIILAFFGYFVLNDAIVVLLSLLPATPYTMPYIVICHGCWLCWATIGRLRRVS